MTMLLAFDMKTSVFTYILTNFLYTLILSFTWYQSRHRNWGVGLILADFILKGIGMSLACMRETWPPTITILLANIFMFSGSVCMLMGMAQFLKCRIIRWPLFLYTLLFASLYAWFALVTPDVRVRIVLFGGMFAPLMLSLCHLIFFKADAAHRRYATQVGITAFLFALVSLARCVFAITGEPMVSYFNQPSTDSFLVIVCQILSIYLAYSIQLMINTKLFDLADLQLNEFQKMV